MIKNAYPENTVDILYIESLFPMNVADLLEVINKHFGPNIGLEELNISSEKIHTRCITYDKYDPGDYDNYIIIERN